MSSRVFLAPVAVTVKLPLKTSHSQVWPVVQVMPEHAPAFEAVKLTLAIPVAANGVMGEDSDEVAALDCVDPRSPGGTTVAV